MTGRHSGLLLPGLHILILISLVQSISHKLKNVSSVELSNGSEEDSSIIMPPLRVFPMHSHSGKLGRLLNDDVIEYDDDPENLKETTRIVTIQIFPPPAANNASNTSSSPMTVSIPNPFDGLGVDNSLASMEQKRSESPKSHTQPPQDPDVSKKIAHGSHELSNVDYTLLCRDGPPYLVDGQPLYCAVSTGCPVGYWCHTGSSKATTFCCPHAQKDNGCSMPMVAGYGSGQMERWYFDLTDGVCKVFVYTGYGGNQNNFLTSQDCADACGLLTSAENTKEILPEQVVNVPSPVPITKGPIPSPTSASPTAVHLPSVTPTHIVPTPRNISNTIPARCHEQGGVTGTGSAYTTRWGFDKVSGECKTFMYAGKGGTNNNFYSEFECTYTCKGSTQVPSTKMTTTMEPPSKCNLPYNKGTGYETILRWFYNSQVGQCQQFTYMGTGGNENNFISMENCRTACQAEERIEEEDPCYLPLDFGIGNNRTTRFYFDFTTNECQMFHYLGSSGNKNSFMSLEECKYACTYEIGQPIESPRQHPNPNMLPTNLKSVAIGGGLSFANASVVAPVQPVYLNQSFLQQPVQPNPQVQQIVQPNTQGAIKPGYPLDFMPVSTHTNVGPGPITGKWVPINGPQVNIPDNQNVIASAPNVYVRPVPSSELVQNPNHVASNPNVPFVPNPNVPFASNSNVPVAPNQNVPIVPNPNANVPVAVAPIPFVPPPYNPNSIQQSMVANPSPLPPPPIFIPPQQPVNNPFPYAILQPANSNNAQQPGKTNLPPMNKLSQSENNRNDSRLVTITSMEASKICNGPITTGDITVCGTENDFLCPEGYQCHRGVPFSLCCPQRVVVSTCNMAPDEGSGENLVTRWHYNYKTARCETFLYQGLDGNANNFLTFDHCTKACGSNPCGIGKPFRVNDENLHCGAMPQATCPSNFYCHMGSDPFNTVCCPRQGNPCSLPMTPGTGSEQVQRWFFDSASRKCQYFIYTGLGGNENNYLTEPECLSSCQVRRQSTSPCGTGQAAQSGRGELVFCSTSSSNSCPPQYWCHIGAGPESTICCPFSAGSIGTCNLQLNTGRGNAVLPRWYYDKASSMCKAFTYTGLGGNENNFLSLSDCRTICPEFENPCPAGRPPMGTDGQVQYCSTSDSTCPNNYWCHIGADKQNSVCCPFSGNACNLPRLEGTGTGQLPRYYFDKVLKQCRPLTYTGKGGNQNNFVSKAECEAACPTIDNPCAEGMPALDADGSPVFCSTANPDVCPESYWCHIGANAGNTLCCPGSADPCRMPASKGSGTAVLNRWYFNTDTKTCLSFTYSGRNGNQNNFLSLGECRITCPEFQNPCSTGQPHISLSGHISHCGATSPSLCPTTYWCHVGATLESSVCCPGASNPCDLPLEVGSGRSNLVRYYYDNDKLICKQFQYTGMGGNENNFITVSDCEQRCPVFRNPCGSGSPAKDRHGHVIPCSVSDATSCPNNYWCHVGSDEQSTVCCPGADFPCTQTLQIGNGNADLPRFYYNSLTQQCLPFTYSGIAGNQNNYLSRADCEKSCPVFVNPCSQGQPATGPNGQYVVCTASTPNVCPANYWCHVGDISSNSVCCPGDEIPCVLPLSTGNGNAMLSRWYFDTNVRRCTRFTYTGMGGNPNNFLTVQDCQLRCPEYENPCLVGDPAQSESGGVLYCSTSAPSCPDNHWCHVGSDPDSTVCCFGDSDPCTQPMLPGSGSSKLNRWYFNQNTKQCLQFTYTGKRGNQNNFLSESECVKRCPVFKNPCGANLPPTHVVYCTAQNRDVCPAGYWCHIGTTAESSVCCPGAGDPCMLEPSQGAFTGAQPMVRWHFDTKEKRCKQFQYAGTAGNQNNFQTQQECQQKCPEFVNPCLRGEPYKEKSSSLVRYCSRNNPTDCPTQFWCHVGANSYSSVCCPGAGDPCTLPVSVGNGPASLPRWYFNVINRQCQQFTYSGLSGNQNNFQTQKDCQTTCPEFTNPCSEGTPLAAVNGQMTYCTAQNPNICPVKYFCHVGPSAETTVCCPTIGDSCNLPKLVGRGNAALQRWHFNSLTRRCDSFTYSGAGGNANNFMTLESCRIRCQEFNNPCQGEPYRTGGGQLVYCNSDSSCPPKYFCHYGIDTTTTMCCPAHGADDVCLMPVLPGSGAAKLTRWYHNPATKACVSFVYSGMGGNENNFRSQAECQATCRPAPNPCAPGTNPLMDGTGHPQQCESTMFGTNDLQCPSGFFCHAGSDPSTTVCCPLQGNPCDLPQNIGTGSVVLQRWYFDKFAGHCQMFTYTGIGGNANNFITELECHRKCGSGQVPRQSARNNPNIPKCAHGEPILSVLGLPQICVKDLQGPVCPSTFVCVLNSLKDGICCPDPKVFCYQTWQAGSHVCASKVESENDIRFGYNPEMDSCFAFRYTGCGGNLNNFASFKQCMDICSIKSSSQTYDKDSDIVKLNDNGATNGTEDIGVRYFNETESSNQNRTLYPEAKVGWLRSMVSWFKNLAPTRN